MKITILGCGALGMLWLVALNRQGHYIQGWLKVPRSTCDVKVINVKEKKEDRLQFLANNEKHLSESNLLLVALKAWQISKSVKKLLPKLRTDCIILLLHNGLGAYEELLPILVQPLVIGITTHAVYREDNKIYHVNNGITFIGPGNVKAKSLRIITTQLLNSSLPEVIWHDNITAISWIKFAANCIINPLTAIYNCRNGLLERYSKEVETVCREITLLMNREGFHFHHESLLIYIKQIIHCTENNFSSMLQDIRANRKSEIDYITGYALRRAHLHGISLPKNQRIFDQIKKKERFNYV
ncbi:2-dehydropantoate 2-reductase [Sodalis sp. CWE]|uniref:2-dehydropantoate 2-reductase n=1 Tax=Sodalis sp. CWE TaxID=2803816 RepID=UPI001C7CC522|nr:2-dehydropantoate 2-reductase [Sodalis sp. CWE]MBX4181203.1 2-dehydropantoate 2-reductase [Sodalis sp. CWE]